MEGRATSYEDLHSQLTQTPKTYQSLSHQPGAQKSWSKVPGTYVAGACLV